MELLFSFPIIVLFKADITLKLFQYAISCLLNKDRMQGNHIDAILKQGEVEYKVHKCVLAVQSDFFKTRFSDRWDVKNGVYTGKVESQEMALKLLPVTDKYQFKKLKAICESVISSQLNKQNVLEIIHTSKAMGCSRLNVQV